jgi:glycerophosphoryl diester phosphodiesterase
MKAQEILSTMYADNRVLVYGHRGASAYAPMNTIPAFQLALKQGADGIELDVHLSKDGHLVIVHDFAVDQTTDGEGTVAEMTLAELKALDAGSWFDAKFTATRIPTLDEVFEAVGQKLYVNVEIKSLAPVSDGVEDAVAACITRHNMQERVIVSSFNPRVLTRFRAVSPDIPLGYLVSPGTMAGTTQPMILPEDYDARHLYFEMVDSTQMNWAKEYKHIVNTWTVNDPTLARQLRMLGVHGIITDKPDVIVAAFK